MFDIVMPKLGESILEATITKWIKKTGDKINEDDALVEIATDKVDSEVPSPVAGEIAEILYAEGDVVAVGTIIARIAMEGENTQTTNSASPVLTGKVDVEPANEQPSDTETGVSEKVQDIKRFYSPLVKKIAKDENISPAELEEITGSGENGRLTKDDLLKWIRNRNTAKTNNLGTGSVQTGNKIPYQPQTILSPSGSDEIIEMSRMRKLIADHMVASVHTSPHVTSFIEVDMTAAVLFREKNKTLFEKNHGTKLTFTHLIMHFAAATLREFPVINASVNGSQIILHKNINLGFATVLPDGNLIVPVVKNAHLLNLEGFSLAVNDLAGRARENKLQPDEIQGGTFTFTNLGSFGSLIGTPIINQPQVAILAAGVITKKPVVLETTMGDTIAIRHMMMMSLSYDHRIVDGGLGGLFIKKIKERLEAIS